MTRRLLAALLLTLSVNQGLFAMDTPDTRTAYDFTFTKLRKNNEPLPLSAYRGKVLLVVNTASQCGFTPQYKDLETLYNTYKDQGLVIVGIPSDDFGHQEPGDASSIEQVCRYNYGVTFPMANKEVVTGSGAHPFYTWVHQRLGFGSAPKWNFHKYLISRSGQPVTFFFSPTGPLSTTVTKAIEKELSKPVPPLAETSPTDAPQN